MSSPCVDDCDCAGLAGPTDRVSLISEHGEDPSAGPILAGMLAAGPLEGNSERARSRPRQILRAGPPQKRREACIVLAEHGQRLLGPLGFQDGSVGGKRKRPARIKTWASRARPCGTCWTVESTQPPRGARVFFLPAHAMSTAAL
jgi:hypothetical protein